MFNNERSDFNQYENKISGKIKWKNGKIREKSTNY